MITELNRLEEILFGNESGFFHADCMDVLKLIPDNAVHLLLTDPPYGINAESFGNGAGLKDHAQGSTVRKVEKAHKGRLNKGSGKLKNRVLNTQNCGWDFEPPKPECFRELFRVSMNQVIWGGNYFSYLIQDSERYGLPPTRGIAAWDKKQPWENFSQFELAWTSFDTPAALFSYKSTNEKGKQHPTQKPLALMKWCIERYARPDDIIIDPFAGSGTTCVAAYQTGHKYIGIEKDDFYYEKALERITSAESQMNLFQFI